MLYMRSSQAFNDPTITGFKTCDRPARKYTMGVQTGDLELQHLPGEYTLIMERIQVF